MKVSGKVTFADQVSKTGPFSNLEVVTNIVGGRQTGRTVFIEKMIRNTLHAMRLLRYKNDFEIGGDESGQKFKALLKEHNLGIRLDDMESTLPVEYNPTEEELYLNRLNQLEIPPVVVLSPNLKMRFAGAAIAPKIKKEAFLAIINPNFMEVTILENDRVRKESYDDFMEETYADLEDVMLFLDGIQVGKWQAEGFKFLKHNNVMSVVTTLLKGKEDGLYEMLFESDINNLRGKTRITYKEDGSKTFNFVKKETKY